MSYLLFRLDIAVNKAIGVHERQAAGGLSVPRENEFVDF
jgi:hypothetical protein